LLTTGALEKHYKPDQIDLIAVIHGAMHVLQGEQE
jgi:hypothetical protein